MPTTTLFGRNISHGTHLRRLVEQGHVNCNNFIQVGLCGYSPSNNDLAWMSNTEKHFLHPHATDHSQDS